VVFILMDYLKHSEVFRKITMGRKSKTLTIFSFLMGKLFRMHCKIYP